MPTFLSTFDLFPGSSQTIQCLIALNRLSQFIDKWSTISSRERQKNHVHHTSKFTFPFYIEIVYTFSFNNFLSVEWRLGFKVIHFSYPTLDLSRICDILIVNETFFFKTFFFFLSTFWTLICNNHYYIGTFLNHHIFLLLISKTKFLTFREL